MLEAWSFKFIEDDLRYRFGLIKYYEDYPGPVEYSDEDKYSTDLILPIGILLARPKQELTEKEILPNLEYFHHRSGEAIHFYCGGYGRYWYKDGRLYNDAINVTEDKGYWGDIPWKFSPQAFVHLVEEIELESEWKYSGGVELLLLNTWVNGYNELVIDFDTLLSINLTKACKDKVVEDIQHLFEEIFRIARNQKENLSVSSLKSSLTKSSFTRSAKEGLLKLVPKNLGEEGKKALYFTSFGKIIR